MSESIPIPVEYIITTTSDWTVFQITEGGWWSDFKVKCIEGVEKLTKEILWNEKTIAISKEAYDRTRVVVNMKCTLNIPKGYLQADLSYLITKGDIESTVVEVIVAERGRHTLVNATKIPNDWRNPLHFNVPVRQYIQTLEEKQMVEKAREKQTEKIEAWKELQPHVIVTNFNDMFKEIFDKKEPTESDVKEIFGFLRSNGRSATKFLDAETCRDLTLQAQTRFWRFPKLKKYVCSEADKTLEEIRKRYDELRKIEGKFSFQATGLGGIEKGEKRVTPEE